MRALTCNTEISLRRCNACDSNDLSSEVSIAQQHPPKFSACEQAIELMDQEPTSAVKTLCNKRQTTIDVDKATGLRLFGDIPMHNDDFTTGSVCASSVSNIMAEVLERLLTIDEACQQSMQRTMLQNLVLMRERNVYIVSSV